MGKTQNRSNLFNFPRNHLQAFRAEAGLLEPGNINSRFLQLNITTAQACVGAQAFEAVATMATYFFNLVFSVFSLHFDLIIRLTFFILPPRGGFILEIFSSALSTCGYRPFIASNILLPTCSSNFDLISISFFTNK